MKKRLLSLLLVASLTAGMISGVAFAADENGEAAEEMIVEEAEEVAEDAAAQDEELIVDEGVDAKVNIPHVKKVELKIDNPKYKDTFKDYADTLIMNLIYDDDSQHSTWVPREAVKFFEYDAFDYDDVVKNPSESYVMAEKEHFYGLDLFLDSTDEYNFDSTTTFTLNGSSKDIFMNFSGYGVGEKQSETLYISFALPLEVTDEPADENEPYYLDIPYELVVEKGGDVAPSAQEFVINVKNVSETYGSVISVSGNKVKTNGVGTYKGYVRVTLKKSKGAWSNDLYNDEFCAQNALILGAMPNSKWSVKGPKAYGTWVDKWIEKYEPVYLASAEIEVGSEDEYWGGVYTMNFVEIDPDTLGESDTDNELYDVAKFTVVYTEKKAAPANPNKNTTTKKYSSPATGDTNSSFAWIIVMVAAVVGAAGVVIFRRVRR